MSLPVTLVDLQKNAGAVFDEQASAQGPLNYGNPHGEYAVAESEAAMIDFTHRCHLELTGGDCVKFLQNFCTNDLAELTAGTGCEAFLTSIQGKVLAHLFVFRGPESIQLETAAGTEEPIFAHLDRYLISEDVEIRRQTDQFGEFLLTGADTAQRLEGFEISAGAMAPLDHQSAELDGIAVQLRRVDWTSQPGYLLRAPRGDLAAVWVRLTESGLRPVGSEAFHAHRIEACMPLDRIDITDDNLAQEVARTDRTISFSKGCYLGQEPIARIDALGHVNRELRGIRLSRAPAPAPQTEVLGYEGGDAIGVVTSSAISYRDDHPVALAYLGRNYQEAGKTVFVQSADDLIAGTVYGP